LKKIIAEEAPEDYGYQPETGLAKARKMDYEMVDVIPVSDPNSSTMAQLLEASAEKKVGRYALRLRAGYSRAAAAAAISDPDYWYRYAGAELVVPF
jgi:hypothetical protein